MKDNADYKEYVHVKESLIHGKGIFISKPVREGEKIMDISGDVIDGYECERREDEENNVYIFWNGDNCYIDTSMTDYIKYINHDCEFNCDVVESDNGGLMLIAYRNIKAGDELTIDYGYEDIYDDCECNTCYSK
jgi:SET domain-containing protein